MELGERETHLKEDVLQGTGSDGSAESDESEGSEQNENPSHSEDEDNEAMVRSIDSFLKPDGKREPELKLQRSLLLAALACILRPTNILIWACLAAFTLFRRARRDEIVVMKWSRTPVIISRTWPALRANREEQHIFVKEALICG